jgi:hypothetical protein
MLLNEENKDLNKKGSYIIVSDEFKDCFKNDKVTYTNLTTKKNRLEKKDELDKKESKLLKWINNKLKKESNKVDAPKRTRMNLGIEGRKQGEDGFNNYRKRESTKIPGVGEVLKVNESEIKKEMESIRYLIEYMDNNKNKIL